VPCVLLKKTAAVVSESRSDGRALQWSVVDQAKRDPARDVVGTIRRQQQACRFALCIGASYPKRVRSVKVEGSERGLT